MYFLNKIVCAENPTPILKVHDIRPMNDFRLWVRFSTGEAKVIDFTPLLSEPAFCPLRDPSLFNGVRLDYGIPVWNGGEIDIAPEYLYDNGTAVGCETAG